MLVALSRSSAVLTYMQSINAIFCPLPSNVEYNIIITMSTVPKSCPFFRISNRFAFIPAIFFKTARWKEYTFGAMELGSSNTSLYHFLFGILPTFFAPSNRTPVSACTISLSFCLRYPSPGTCKCCSLSDRGQILSLFCPCYFIPSDYPQSPSSSFQLTVTLISAGIFPSGNKFLGSSTTNSSLLNIILLLSL